MFDAQIKPLIGSQLDPIGARIAGRDITANEVTLAGLGLGAIAALMLTFGLPGLLVLAPLLLGRLADGLDGAVARATQGSAFGGYLDLLSDLAFFGLIVLGFVFRDPGNAVTGAILLLIWALHGAGFLGYALLAEQQEPEGESPRVLYRLAGLVEGTEIFAFLVAFCLWPDSFRLLATLLMLLCLVAFLARLALARRLFAG